MVENKQQGHTMINKSLRRRLLSAGKLRLGEFERFQMTICFERRVAVVWRSSVARIGF